MLQKREGAYCSFRLIIERSGGAGMGLFMHQGVFRGDIPYQQRGGGGCSRTGVFVYLIHIRDLKGYMMIGSLNARRGRGE